MYFCRNTSYRLDYDKDNEKDSGSDCTIICCPDGVDWIYNNGSDHGNAFCSSMFGDGNNSNDASVKSSTTSLHIKMNGEMIRYVQKP